MQTIAEQNLLVRARIKLPAGIRPATEEFREGWNFAGTVPTPELKKKILKQGWTFSREADSWLRSGVGETPQMAIANGLNLALRYASPQFNAVAVERIEWTQYPWFYLARVTVKPYRLEQNAFLAVPDSDLPRPQAGRHRQLPPDDAALFPNFGCTMPMLREMLVLSRSSQAPFNPSPTIQ